MKVFRQLCGSRGWWEFFCPYCNRRLEYIGSGKYAHPTRKGPFWKRETIDCPYIGKVVKEHTPIEDWEEV